MSGKWIVAMSVSLMVCADSLWGAGEKPRELNPAEFAPIKYPFIVSWYYPGKSPSESTAYTSKYLNINTSAKGSVDGWSDLGVLPLLQIGYRYVGAAKSQAEAGHAGVCFDELTQSDEKYPDNWRLLKACGDIKKSYPNFYIGVHGNTCPPSLIDAFDKGYVDGFYLENYTYYYGGPPMVVSLAGIRQRIKIFRAADLLDKTIWHIGNIEPQPDQYFPKGFSLDRLEREIQLIRRWGPEVGGICFYFWPLHTRTDHPLFPHADDLTYEYFIKPAPNVSVTVKEMRDGLAKVSVTAGKSSFGGKAARYNIFLDENLVSDRNEWIWETKNSPAGEHLVTAHAISSDWYRGGSQVSVVLEDGKIKKTKELPDDRPKSKRIKRLAPAKGGEPTTALAVNGDIAYVGVSKSIHVLDLKTGFFPRKIAELALEREPERFMAAGDFLYVAAAESGVIIVDVSESANPKIVGRFPAVAYAEDVFAIDNVLLVAAGSDGLVLLDTTHAARPERISSYPLSHAWGVTAEDGIGYVAAGFDGLAIIDISNPSKPRLHGVQDTVDCALRVAVSEGVACVADWHGGVRIIDVSKPTEPKEIGNHYLPWAWDVAIKGKTVYAADENIGLRAIDISDPANMKAWIVWNMPEAGDTLNALVVGDNVFSVDGWVGMRAFDISKGADKPERKFVYTIDSIWNIWQKGVADYELPGSSSTSGAKEFEERTVVETADVPVAPADESTIVGTWELTATSSDDSHKGELIVNEDHSGTYNGPDGKLEISKLRIEGDKVSFTIMVPSPGDMFGDVRTDLKGVLQGATLKGEWVNYRGGGPEEVTGKRIKN